MRRMFFQKLEIKYQSFTHLNGKTMKIISGSNYGAKLSMSDEIVPFNYLL